MSYEVSLIKLSRGRMLQFDLSIHLSHNWDVTDHGWSAEFLNNRIRYKYILNERWINGKITEKYFNVKIYDVKT